MKFEELSPKLQEKAKACKTPGEILDLAKEEGYELSDAELEGIAGGDHWACKCDESYGSYIPVN